MFRRPPQDKDHTTRIYKKTKIQQGSPPSLITHLRSFFLLTNFYKLKNLGYLRATPSELLVKAGARIAVGAAGQSADLQSTVALPFLPALEPEGADAFLTQAPRDTLPGADVPFLTGYNAQEGIILFRRK